MLFGLHTNYLSSVLYRYAYSTMKSLIYVLYVLYMLVHIKNDFCLSMQVEVGGTRVGVLGRECTLFGVGAPNLQYVGLGGGGGIHEIRQHWPRPMVMYRIKLQQMGIAHIHALVTPMWSFTLVHCTMWWYTWCITNLLGIYWLFQSMLHGY